MNTEWLMSVSEDPIQCNLKYLQNDTLSVLETAHLLQHPEVQYWLNQLENATSKPMIKINGAHDYQYENLMGKLYTLGIRSDISEFDQYASIYLDFLHKHVKRDRCKGIYLSEIFANYDYELILAAFLSLLGYKDDPAVNYVVLKRIRILYKFVKQNRESIYVDGKDYPGVCTQWQYMLIDPDLYSDSNIGFPTVYDYHLLASVYQSSDDKTKEKIDAIVSWLFSDTSKSIPKRYGYFYLPNDARKAKPVCWKFVLPTIKEVFELNKYPPEILHAVFVLSHFKACNTSSWYANLLTYLESYKTSDGHYRFLKTLITEQTGGFYVFGKHMGVGQPRDQSSWIEIESTYWMERIQHNMALWQHDQA